jgi:membrane protease YdiL (CAAX protease family)
VAYCLVVCLAIGVFEEAMLRGIALGGLLAAFGRRRSGMAVAVTLTALAFGCMHVDWTTTDVADPLQLAQALLKIAQTGIYSVVLSACVMRSGSLVGASLYHAFDDFLLMVVANGIYGEAMTTEYVSSGDDAPVTVGFYVILVALYVPSLVRAVRELKEMPMPQYGPLVNKEKVLASAEVEGIDSDDGGERRGPVHPPDPRS